MGDPVSVVGESSLSRRFGKSVQRIRLTKKDKCP